MSIVDKEGIVHVELRLQTWLGTCFGVLRTETIWNEDFDSGIIAFERHEEWSSGREGR